MTQEIKTAIKAAEQSLEDERQTKLQQEIKSYLKSELDEIDRIDQQISKLKTDKLAHEENIKNLKAGNLKAIEDRRLALGWPTPYDLIHTWQGMASNSWNFYNQNIAGFTYQSPFTGKTYIF